MATKREKEQAVLAAAAEWGPAYEAWKNSEGLDEDELKKIDGAHEKAGDALYEAQAELNAHVSAIKEHPGAEYYEVEVAGKKVKKARCRFCAHELNPRGVTRHVLSPACKKSYAALVELDLDNEDDVEQLDADVVKFCKKHKFEPPKQAESNGGDEDGDED